MGDVEVSTEESRQTRSEYATSSCSTHGGRDGGRAHRHRHQQTGEQPASADKLILEMAEREDATDRSAGGRLQRIGGRAQKSPATPPETRIWKRISLQRMQMPARRSSCPRGDICRPSAWEGASSISSSCATHSHSLSLSVPRSPHSPSLPWTIVEDGWRGQKRPEDAQHLPWDWTRRFAVGPALLSLQKQTQVFALPR